MKTIQKQTTFILLLILTINTYAQSWQFAHTLGGRDKTPYGDNLNHPQCMEVDDEGNTYVFGSYGAGMSINDSLLPQFYDASSGTYLVKYNCAGEVDWYKGITNTQQTDQRAKGMQLKGDYLYICGNVEVPFSDHSKMWWIDTLIQDAWTLPNEYPFLYGRHDYIIKMDLEGNIIENRLLYFFANENSSTDPTTPTSKNEVALKKKTFVVDNEGAIYLWGYLPQGNWSVLMMDTVPISDTLYTEKYKEQILIKLDADFNFLWCKPLVEGLSDTTNRTSIAMRINDMRCDNNNDIYAVGVAETSCEANDTAKTNILFANNQSITTYGDRFTSRTGFLLKISSEGELQWARHTKQFYEILDEELGGYSVASFKNIVLDEITQKVYVTGEGTTIIPSADISFNMGTIFGESDTLINPDAEGKLDYILQYDMQGNYLGHKTPKASHAELGGAALYNGEIYAQVSWIVGLEHQDSVYVDSTRAKHLAICVWDTLLNPVASINIPSTCMPDEHEHYPLVPYNLQVNNRGEISITGVFDKGTLAFGDSTFYNLGYEHATYIAKYGKACPTVLEEDGNFCYGDTYRDTTLLQSGNYQFVVETAEADSVINLNATVHPPLVTGLIDTAVNVNETLYLECVNQDYDSYQWSTGSNTYYENLNFSNIGTEMVTIALNDEGCSGVDTIFVQVKKTDGIDELEKAPIYIYPNPAKKVVYLQDVPKDINMVELWDITGKKLKTINLNQTQSIDVENLKQGVYFIKAGQLVRKLIKQ